MDSRLYISSKCLTCLMLFMCVAIVCGSTISLSIEGRSSDHPLKADARLTAYSYAASEVNERGEDCYEHKCRCYNEVADCSGNGGNLTFVPNLPKEIRELYFAYNNLTNITRDNFFQNVTGISVLGLQGNGLRSISPGVFRRLRRLNTVILEGNSLNYNSLVPVLSVVHLQKLDVRQQVPPLGHVPDFFFHKHTLPYLETLYLHSNNLKHVKLFVFAPLQRLRELGLAQSKVKSVKTYFLPSLEKLNLGSNAIMEFPPTCDHSGESLFPNLTHLSLDENLIRSIPKDVCLPKLQLLELRENIIRNLNTDTFHTARFPMLREVYLQSMQAYLGMIDSHAFNSTTLQKISLMYNNIDFSKDYIHPDCFAGCTALGDLQLGHNFFSDCTDEKMQRLFRPIPKLQRLYLGSSQISRFTDKTFKGLTSIVYLSLYRNQLTTLPAGAFDELPNLKYLSLNNNQLSVIPQAAFSPTVRRTLTHLDLSGNPFTCTCELLWFRDWMVSNPTLFNNSYKTYQCIDDTRTPVTSFRMQEQACLLSDVVSKSIIASICLVVTSAFLTASLWRYRWHIRLVLYEAFKGDKDVRRQRLLSRHFRYDVFVCYDAENVDWVRAHLMPELEGRLGLRLCVHQRDFRPGKHIVENIVDSVQSSKKVITVFSKGFARSHWCQFELNWCLSHVIENDDALVVVCLDDVSSRDLTPAMMAVLKTTTYIQWDENPDATASFWGCLEQALQEILEVRSA